MSTPYFRKKSVERILEEARQSGNHGHQLKKSLGLKDLTALGIAAIIGAGIFSTIGNASAAGGPAVILLFVFTGIACAFSAMSYAEFASSIPISGSAYTYAYAAFGEVVAWIIGWALIVEYAIGNIVVAISWSDYFTGLLAGLNIHIPAHFTMDYLTASRGFTEVSELLQKGQSLASLTATQQEAYTAWLYAPEIAGLKMVFDLPALGIVLLITTLIYRGIHETKSVGNIFVGLKLIVIVMVIIVGSFYVDPANWSPFAPNGMQGVLSGVASVFFAYIGFDALATTAEECKQPSKDLPKAMIFSLLLCTGLYILISLTLTGMVSYTELAVGDPLAFVFGKVNLDWMQGIIAVSAVIAMASVLLVFQMGQPRIWMSMSRDGLLPAKFSKIHPKYKTPAFATLVTGVLVSVPALFMNLKEVTDLSSIGTLFAFVLVNAGVIRMENHKAETFAGFRVPFFNGKWLTSILFVALMITLYFTRTELFLSFFRFEEFGHRFTTWLLLIVAVVVCVRAYRYQYSLLPVLGLMSNLYLMTELGLSNWLGFTLWLILGLVIYFTYGRKNSKLQTSNTEAIHSVN